VAKSHRWSTTVALIVCLVGTPCSGILFASEQEEPSSGATSSSPSVIDTAALGAAADMPVAAVIATEATATAVSEPPSAAVERLRAMLNDEGLTPNAPLGGSGGQAWHSRFNFRPTELNTFAQRGGYWGRGRGRGRHDGAAAAMVLGTVATIAGGAILIYANRPECSANEMASGCGYGAKVVGGAVLTAGVVGLVIGAVTW
jgi:hypothetical protein